MNSFVRLKGFLNLSDQLLGYCLDIIGTQKNCKMTFHGQWKLFWVYTYPIITFYFLTYVMTVVQQNFLTIEFRFWWKYPLQSPLSSSGELFSFKQYFYLMSVCMTVFCLKKKLIDLLKYCFNKCVYQLGQYRCTGRGFDRF